MHPTKYVVLFIFSIICVFSPSLAQ